MTKRKRNRNRASRKNSKLALYLIDEAVKVSKEIKEIIPLKRSLKSKKNFFVPETDRVWEKRLSCARELAMEIMPDDYLRYRMNDIVVAQNFNLGLCGEHSHLALLLLFQSLCKLSKQNQEKLQILPMFFLEAGEKKTNHVFLLLCPRKLHDRKLKNVNTRNFIDSFTNMNIAQAIAHVKQLTSSFRPDEKPIIFDPFHRGIWPIAETDQYGNWLRHYNTSEQKKMTIQTDHLRGYLYSLKIAAKNYTEIYRACTKEASPMISLIKMAVKIDLKRLETTKGMSENTPKKGIKRTVFYESNSTHHKKTEIKKRINLLEEENNAKEERRRRFCCRPFGC